MKRMICIVAVLALCAPVLAQETLELRIVDEFDASSVDGSSGGTFNIEIQGRLNTTSSEGLALWGVNLDTNGSTYVGYDLCAQLTDLAPLAYPDGSAYFEKNRGLTNPDGFGGTCNGDGGLWQIGGGQNTIGNTGPTAYPFGPVVTGFCNGTSWTTLAEGSVTIPALSDDLVLRLNTGFANTIDSPVTGPPVYDVSMANVSIVGDLTFTGGLPPVPPEIVGSWYSRKSHGALGDLDKEFDPSFTGDPHTVTASWEMSVPVDGIGMETRKDSVTDLWCTFSEPMDTTSITTADVIVTSNNSAPINPTSLSWTNGDTELHMIFSAGQLPNGQLLANLPDRYVACITSNLVDANDGLSLVGDTDVEFICHFGNVWPFLGGKYKTNSIDRSKLIQAESGAALSTALIAVNFDIWNVLAGAGKVNSIDRSKLVQTESLTAAPTTVVPAPGCP